MHMLKQMQAGCTAPVKGFNITRLGIHRIQMLQMRHQDLEFSATR